MNRWTTLLLLVGCAPGRGFLPLLDADGARVGVYDPSIGSIEVGLDGDTIEVPSGTQADLVGGIAAIDEALTPGDLLVIHSDGATEALTVGDAEGADDGRYGSCFDFNN
ncbi:MAG: hypothetical protein ABMA64_17800 [Myxococcota bacterium]